LRIALAHSQLNTFGGGERAVLEVARRFTARHNVRLLVGDFQPSRTYGELSRFPHSQLTMRHWFEVYPGDDVIVTNSFGANLLALRNGERVIYWVHSLRSRFLQPRALRPDLLLRRALDWLAVRRTARLVANSHYTAVRLRSLYRREADEVIYPGVDLELFQPAPNTGAYAITVGRLSPEKGVDVLLRLWRELQGIPLHIVGDGDPDFMYQLQAVAPPGVVFRGPLQQDEVVAAYQQAAVAVFTPRGEEFGIAPVEAMACGVPVVAWRDGGLMETVVDGSTGYLVADEQIFRQRVRSLIEDHEHRSILGQAARQRAEQFSWERTVRELERMCIGVAQSL
jgi:glycosyltransferase involved in cell wall biosynthesis